MKTSCIIFSKAVVAGLLLSACSTTPIKKMDNAPINSETKKPPVFSGGLASWVRKGYKRSEPYSHGRGKIRKGEGLLTGKDGTYTLYRSGETRSVDPGKPKKLKR
jgi:hypothetical protein